jgi:ATP synthase protein I
MGVRCYDARGLGDPDDGLSPLAKGYRAAAPWLSAVWRLFGGVAFGVVAGVFIDRWLGSSPVATLVGSLLGMAAGFYGFIQGITALSKKPDEKKDGKS